jgi:UDP-N-acetylglucosamine 2-epimerase (non-hydrolysing)
LKIAIIIGTRPEIIKMAPVCKALDAHGVSFFILHSGQHYSYNLDRSFFELLGIKQPGYNLEVGSCSQAEQTAKIMIGVEKIMKVEFPDIVLVQGDTNTVLGGALAACKLHIPIGHVESGLRSYDRRMPEEINRILVDHCSDYLFAPTNNARQILINEGISKDKIFVSGNTIADVVSDNVGKIEALKGSLETFGLSAGEYFLLTLHRQENVDDPHKFGAILEGLNCLHREYSMPIVFPVHPRTQKLISDFGFNTDFLLTMEPVDYFTFLLLEKHANLILTDSGGVQEEACILCVPCVTLRENTERPETIEVGANTLAGSDASLILKSVQFMLSKERAWINPFGDGNAGEKIVHLLMERN